MNAPRHLYTLNIAITLKSPWLVHGNEPGKFGLDVTLMRDHQGRPILPGSLIQGRLRHAWKEMSTDFGLEMPDPEAIFGKEYKEGEEFTNRGTLLINDLTAQIDEARLMNTRVPIDRGTGAAQQGMLVMIEQTCPPGTLVDFKGAWCLWATDDEAKQSTRQIQAGLNWQSQLGAQRSVGFGQIEKVAVDCQQVEKTKSSAPATPKNTSLRISLSFDSPICVESRSRGNNTFVSGDVITGGTLKGAIATLLRQRYGQSVQALHETNALAKHFDALRVSHAFPSGNEKRPAQIPKSLASVENDIYDLAEINGPRLINEKAPSFFHDWKCKTWKAVCEKQAWGNTSTHLRVRTAIDEATRTAQDAKLFAYECRVPEKNTRWLADLSLAAIPESERGKVGEALQDLLQHGIGPIGKTDAWASISFSNNQAEVWPQQATLGKTVVVQLNTPALLIASGQVANQTDPNLKALYTSLFDELSGPSLTLSHYYTCHSMAGGTFLHYKQKRMKNYQPYVLTDAGSVFVFAVNDEDKAKTILADWQAKGLPLPQAVKDERTDQWQHNPYLPQNGYGEIAVNLQHGFKQPQPEQLSAVESN